MSDISIHAETLLSTVARAFYEDDAILIIDVLLRDKYLRDDDMGPRLHLPAKQLRKTMQFLSAEEKLVKFELVDDLNCGGSQQTKFWYIDYASAVFTITYRIYCLTKQLEEQELKARSSSMYTCPNFKKGLCNGQYSELEAQQVMDFETNMFLCRECQQIYANHPAPPPKTSYTLQMVDSSKDLKQAMDHMRRVKEQLTGKRVGNQQLRLGIYDLLQKIRHCRGVLSSNLPSENFARGIGTERLAGTGRTAGIKAKKRAQELGENAANTAGGNGPQKEPDLTFLNTKGEQIKFEVEKGASRKAFMLANGTGEDRIQKLRDAALALLHSINRQEQEKYSGPKKKARGMTKEKKNEIKQSRFLFCGVRKGKLRNAL